MLSIPGGIEDLLDSGRFSIRYMLKFELDSGPTGLWNDAYDIEVEGVTYAGIAGNMEFDAIPSQSSLASDRLVVSITNLLPAVTTIIAEEQWHQRPCVLMLAILDDAGEVQHDMPRFSGFLDEIEITDAEGDLCKVTLTIESNNRELNRSTGEVRSDPSQRRRSATDDFFQLAASANTDTNIYWGRKGVQQPKQKAGIGGLLSRIF